MWGVWVYLLGLEGLFEVSVFQEPGGMGKKERKLRKCVFVYLSVAVSVCECVDLCQCLDINWCVSICYLCVCMHRHM